jgi:hypothetical protein
MRKRRSGLAGDRRAYTCNCSLPFIIGIVSGPGSSYTSNLTQINFTGIYDAGYGVESPISGVLDDARIPIPMGSTNFNFFGTNYISNLSWSSNNALIFGSSGNPNTDVDIPRNGPPSILVGNYDRMCTGLYYSNTTVAGCSITTLLVNFCNYYTDPGTPSYQYKIRLIKENTGAKRQFVEIYVISSPPSPGYSSAAISYPSGVDGGGHPMDSNGNTIDSTKNSPYNITNGTTFLNPCGSAFSLTSPPANTSFVFSSDSTGSVWTFTNNAHVNI